MATPLRSSPTQAAARAERRLAAMQSERGFAAAQAAASGSSNG